MSAAKFSSNSMVLTTNRILARDKDTGVSVPIIHGAETRRADAAVAPWNHVTTEQVSYDSFENPRLINLTHIMVMQLDERPAYTEWNVGRKVNKHGFVRGEFSFTPVGEAARWRSSVSSTVLITSLTDQLVSSIAADAGLPQHFELVPGAPLVDPFIQAALLSLAQEQQNGSPGGSIYGDSIATAIATHLIMRHGSNRANLGELKGNLKAHTLKGVIDYIKSRYSHNITLDELASLAYMSPYHFSRLFKNSTGFSPYQYILRYRIERAAELLLSGRTTIAEVARATGFWDESHLARQFKKVTGTSLHDYRTSIRGTD